MYLNRIRLENFRNVSSAEVEFSPGVNILYGMNAEGKTNMLEAIGLASLGKSFRGAHETEFISFGEKYAYIGLDFTDSQRTQSIEMRFSRDKLRNITKNGVKLARLSELVGVFRTVLFCPEHLNIIKEGPSMRRGYLDMAISQLKPAYLKSLQSYNRILAQRNKLIKDAFDNRAAFDDTVGIWSMRLAEEGARITVARVEYLARAEGELRRCFADMTGGREEPSLSYDASFRSDDTDLGSEASVREALYNRLMTAHEREISFGSTLWGVHKDDVDIRLNGRSARNFASQGQQRSLSLGLKLAEGAISREECGEEPVFLLDDVFSELDSERRGYLTERLDGRQVIMTTCQDDSFGTAKVIKVEKGRYA